ncbi:MAG: hypothetical protein EYC69_09715 [Bacteroidetes bacterium]|nr:MAG: hypothetical protein EYC69_09715 [Bacteroidota bacterium]
MSHSAYAQFTHEGRGMYVDNFFRTTYNTSGSTIADQNRSVLGVSVKENALLQYSKDNHVTYLILYDLHRVLGNSTFEGYLCGFLQKAKTQYCIEYIGVASSCASMFNSVIDQAGTEPLSFSSPEYENFANVPGFVNQLGFLENNYEPGDSLFYLSEFIKLNMRAVEFNESCAYKFDVMVTEYEFWNTTTDDCTGENASQDQKYQRFQAMINDMDLIRDTYNSTHTGHELFVEAYLGYLNQNTVYAHQSIADWIDGSYNGKRRVDRINLHYYSNDATKMYSRTNAGQNFDGYYNTRFLDFCQSSTNNKTNVLPILSAESTFWGFGSNYLSTWFGKSVNNNIFTAEKIWYNDWYDDAQNHHPSTVGNVNTGNAVAPGAALWFTSSQMVNHLDNPVLFTSNSPLCVGSGQNGSPQFNYQGPIEQGSSYKFYITDVGTSTLRCGNTSSKTWPVYNSSTQSSIDLNASLGSCVLPVGEYDAHLELTYSAACSPYIVPPVRVSIVTSGKIVALTPTSVCQGNPVYLKASSAASGTNTFQWYNGASQISGATGNSYAPDPSSTGTKNISCKITSSIGSCSANLSNVIPVTFNAYPAASISTQSFSACTVVLKANPSGATYKWHDGSTGSTYTTSHGAAYSVGVTVNNCTSNAFYTYQRTYLSFVSNVNTCTGFSNGSITVRIYAGQPGFTLSWSGPVSGTMNNLPAGNATISNLPAGTYSVTATDSYGCSWTLSSNPVISNSVFSVTTNSVPATCLSSSDGTASISSVSGGTGSPYTYRWHLNNSTSSSISGLSPGTYSVDVRDNANCVSVHAVTVGIANPTLSPAIEVSAFPDSIICDGTDVTFSASVVNAGLNPTFQWKVNGLSVGSNSSVYSSDSLEDGDQILCLLYSSESCPDSSPVLSGTIVMQVEDFPNRFMVQGGGSYCDYPGDGIPVNLSGSQSGVVYQLLLNNMPVSGSSLQGNGYPLSFGNQTNVGNYSIIGTSSFACSSTMDSTTNISMQNASVRYRDLDQDGYGDTSIFVMACQQVPGYVDMAGDCADSNSLIHPNAFELCNAADDNCNGFIDENTCDATLGLKVFIQGYFNGSVMTAALYNTGNSMLSDDCDTIEVILIDPSTMNEIESQKAILKTNGECNLNFSFVSIGKPYFLKIVHRSSVETWSSFPITFQTSGQYSFIDSASSAYGNNMVELSTGNWALWSGDISGNFPGLQDGIIDESDILHWENEVINYKSGYYHEDINGDGIIESSDFSILENNFILGIQVSRP